MIAAEEARRNAESCRNVVAESLLLKYIVMRGELQK